MSPIVQLTALLALVFCLGYFVSNLHRRGLSAGQLRAQLDQMRHLIQQSILHSERRTMTALEDLNTKVDALSAEVETANGKADTVIAALVDVRAQLAALSAGATSDDLAAISAKIDATLASVKAQEADDDAAVA